MNQILYSERSRVDASSQSDEDFDEEDDEEDAAARQRFRTICLVQMNPDQLRCLSESLQQDLALGYAKQRLRR